MIQSREGAPEGEVHFVRKQTQEQEFEYVTRSIGLSEATVRRIWHKDGLKPHLVETFKVSTDPHFVEKLEAVVGLYLNPPEHALVLCCDEKSQIQALDRTQPGLPLKTTEVHESWFDRTKSVDLRVSPDPQPRVAFLLAKPLIDNKSLMPFNTTRS